MVDSRKIYTAQELGKFLRENKISPTEAVDIIQKYKLNAFKEGKYKYEGTSKIIPKGHIDELR